MIDMLAQRYGCLPGHILERATDWDLAVALISQRWQSQQQEQAQTGKKKAAVPDVNTLQEMMNRVRNR